MLDEPMRRVKERVFNPLARPFLATSPLFFSLLGLLLGTASAAALWQQAYLWGFILWVLNRVCDGLDGTIARLRGVQSDLGGYLDILIDFVTYALIPIGLVLGRPDMPAIYALMFLLATFYVNAASWMYLAAILEKRQHVTTKGLTSVTMPPGIVGGTETILFYSAFILFPAYLAWLFSVMASLVLVTILQRVMWAARHLT